MVSKGFPNVTTSGRQYNIGKSPPLHCTLTLITMQGHQNHTIKEHRKSRCTIYFDLTVPDYSSTVLEKSKMKLINVSILSIVVRFVVVGINLWEATLGKFK